MGSARRQRGRCDTGSSRDAPDDLSACNNLLSPYASPARTIEIVTVKSACIPPRVSTPAFVPAPSSISTIIPTSVTDHTAPIIHLNIHLIISIPESVASILELGLSAPSVTFRLLSLTVVRWLVADEVRASRFGTSGHCADRGCYWNRSWSGSGSWSWRWSRSTVFHVNM